MTRPEDNPVVWVLEDSEQHRSIFSSVLSSRYDLHFACDLEELRAKLVDGAPRPSVLLADLNLPDGTFLDFFVAHKALLAEMPVIVVSTNSELRDLQQCFKMGAVDYITKPFKFNELIAKISRWQEEYKARSYEVRLKQHAVELTKKEREIFDLLVENNNRSVAKAEIFNAVWRGTSVTDKNFSYQLAGLREKVAPLGMKIEYVKDEGYKLTD